MQYEQQSPPDATLVKAQGRQEVLYTLTDRLHRAQACEDVLDASFWALIRGLSCDRAAVLLMDASATLHVAASHGLSEHYGRSVQAHSPWAPTDPDPRPICLGSLRDDVPGNFRDATLAEGVAAIAFIPLTLDGRLIGEFMVCFDAPHRFDAADIEFALTVARQLAFSMGRLRDLARLRDTQEQLMTMFNVISVGMAEVETTSRRLKRVNLPLCKLLGFTEDELLARMLDDLIHPDDRARHAGAYDRLLASAEPYAIEQRFVRKDGQAVWVLVTANVIRDGPRRRVYATIHDIDQRKHAEQALQRAAEVDAFRLQLADTLRALSDPARIQTEAAGLLGRHLHVGRCYHCSVTAEGTTGIITRDYVAPGRRSAVGTYHLEAFGARLLERLHAGQVVSVADVCSEATLSVDELAAYEVLDVRAFVSVPLVKDGRLVAVFSVDCPEPRAWTPADIALVRETAERTWIALERARTQRALVAHADQFHTLLEHTPIGVCLVDADLVLRELNPVARAAIGNVAGGVLGRGLVEIMHSLYEGPRAEEIVRGFRRTLETGQPFIEPERAERRIDRDRTEHYAWRLDRIRLSDGRFGVVCYFRNVGAQVEARQLIEQSRDALRESEQRLRLIVEGARDFAIILLDAEGRITRWNSGARNLLGYDSEEVIGRHEGLIFTPEDRADFAPQQEITRALDDGRAINERWHVRKDGSRFWGSGLLMTLRRSDERPSGFVKIMQDRTAARLAEERLRETDRRKDEFIAMLAHELRNPLAPITNAVRLLQRDPSDNPVQQEARTIIERQVRRLARLVDDLLDISRITTGRVRLQRARIDMRAVIERAVESIRPSIEQQRHSLECEVSQEPIWVCADAVRLEQVVVNLLSNAAKYTEPGGRIELGLRREGEQAVVTVRDTGIGIEPALLPHVFDLFTQAERTMARSYGGLGIGLALVRRLVQMHGGTITAHSTVGEGSEFIVRLPTTAPAHGVHRPAPAASSLQAAAQRLRMLVVDDNADAARSLALLLTAAGHEVRVAYDGLEALEAAHAFRPDLAFVDIGLPQLDGYEVARRLKADPALSGIELAAVSGYGQVEDRRRSRAAGFRAHLVKPAGFAQVEQFIGEVLEDRT